MSVLFCCVVFLLHSAVISYYALNVHDFIMDVFEDIELLQHRNWNGCEFGSF